MGFAMFMASGWGRIIRIVAGAALVGVGLYMQSTWGVVVAIGGAVPLVAGFFNVCLFAPLFGAPFVGSKLRTQA